MIALVVGIASLVGCKTSGRLAQEIEGDWSGTPIQFNKKLMINGSYTPVVRFERNGEQAGGAVEFSAQLSVTMPVNAPIDSAGTTAVSATAAGLATVRGRWEVHDADEVKLTFDMSTLVVDMDPDVQFELANIWTSGDAPLTQRVSDAATKAFVKQMTEGITAELEKLDEIDDIRIKENLMRCEFLDKERTFNRVFE